MPRLESTSKRHLGHCGTWELSCPQGQAQDGTLEPSGCLFTTQPSHLSHICPLSRFFHSRAIGKAPSSAEASLSIFFHSSLTTWSTVWPGRQNAILTAVPLNGSNVQSEWGHPTPDLPLCMGFTLRNSNSAFIRLKTTQELTKSNQGQTSLSIQAAGWWERKGALQQRAKHPAPPQGWC